MSDLTFIIVAGTAPDLCVTALKIRWQQQDADRAKAGDGWGDTGLVFTTRHGTPIEPRNFSRSFDRWITAARVPSNTVHGTRKTCASPLAAIDVHPRVAMRILRHSKIGITMEIYAEVPSQATRDALRKFGDSCLTSPLLHFAATPDQKRPVPATGTGL